MTIVRRIYWGHRFRKAANFSVLIHSNGQLKMPMINLEAKCGQFQFSISIRILQGTSMRLGLNIF